MADNWRVLSQRQAQELTPDSRFVDVMEVTFALQPSGEVGTVRVPLSMYNAEYVGSAIAERVTHMEAVRDL